MPLLSRRDFVVSCALSAVAGHFSSDQTAELAGLAEQFTRKTKFNGVILAGRGLRVLFATQVGQANFELHTPVTQETVFEGGSISKWIASVTVMHLVDTGTLSLTAPISTYLPAYRKDNGARLTLTHLMSHNSGVPNLVMDALRADPALAGKPMTQQEAVAAYASGDLRFEPGTQWDYSHANWLLVKAIVEQTSRRSYSELTSALLWRPLGLKRSGIFSGKSLDVPGMAQTYKPDGSGQLAVLPSIMPQYLSMAGGFYTTAPEMLKIMDAVIHGKVLSEASRAQLLRVRMPEQHYALGGRIRTRILRGREEEVVWEDGSNKGFRMLAVSVRRTKETVILMNNTGADQPAMGDFADAMLQAICV